jgi:hypothetical protein
MKSFFFFFVIVTKNAGYVEGGLEVSFFCRTFVERFETQIEQIKRITQIFF